MIFLAVILVLSSRAYSTPVTREKEVRTGKFMRFGNADDLFSDVLDEMQDPLSAVEDMSMENVSDRLKDSAHNNDPVIYHVNTKNTSDPIKTEEKIALYNQNTGKFELITSTSGHFMLPTKPVTENGVIFYGGQHYQYHKPGEEDPNHGNRTGEIKIFWSSVTDAIQNLPFIPVQVNVPDMISAMANFLSTSIPIINRFTNPNHPRLPPKPESNAVNSHKYPYLKDDYGSNALYGDRVEDRELKNGEKLNGGKPKKQKKGQKRKHSNSKRKNGKDSSKGLVSRPFFRRTTELPKEDKKVWQSFGSGDPAGTTLKNMPITRRKFLVRDRETFNFKNSDISNSPIMILNLPERPMMYHKTQINQKVEDGKTEGTKQNAPDAVHAKIPPSVARPKDNRQNTKKTAPKRVRNVPKEKTKSNQGISG